MIEEIRNPWLRRPLVILGVVAVSLVYVALFIVGAIVAGSIAVVKEIRHATTPMARDFASDIKAAWRGPTRG